MHILYYILSSYGLIALIIILSTLLNKKGVIGSEGSRKFIHIGVANWYFLALIFMQDPNDFWWLIIPPISFVVLNYISYKKQLISSMERDGKGNMGTVYYPIALLVVLILSFRVFNNPYLGLMGVMIMGYGDGLAAVIGSKYGKKDIGNGKTLLGVFTMFFVSLITASTIIMILDGIAYLWIGLSIALIATLIEYITPKGLDNLSVPIVSTLLYYVLLMI